MAIICKNCGAEVTGNYCAVCGHPALLKRIDAHYVMHELAHVLHVEHGILYTVRSLLLEPGKSVRVYLTENRSKLVKPIIFIILTSLLYSMTINLFHIDQSFVRFEGGKSTAFSIFKWISTHYGYASILMGIFIAGWLRLFFRKAVYNVFEILLLLCFVIGISMLIYAAFALIQGIIGINLLSIGGLVGILYCSWAIGQFYGNLGLGRYIKAFLAYMLGMTSFVVTALLIGFLIDAIR